MLSDERPLCQRCDLLAGAPFHFCCNLKTVLTPKRVYEEELLDAGVGSDLDVQQNLADLRLINKRLGGIAPTIKAFTAELDRWNPKEISILDVGTGSADIPNAIIESCAGRGIKVTAVAVDWSARNLKAARQLGFSSAINLVQADALRLPFAPGSFDFVTASLFLHHFLDEQVVDLLGSFAKIARRAVIVNDLVRNLLPYYLFRIVSPMVASSFMTRHDGALSVLRGFTALELDQMAARAGLNRRQIRRVFPFRLVLVANTGA
ncbi:MAG TPA: methyltransferase domain-containing protein [Blastocatellia bacterium]|nr:methyltransferase domain-containing protein [Blastocatellia bacterium]